MSILLCSASCMFAAEHNRANAYDKYDAEVAYYMSTHAEISYEEHLQKGRDEKVTHKLRNILANLPINECSAETSEKKVDVKHPYSALRAQAIIYINTKPCYGYSPSTKGEGRDVKHPQSALREQALAYIDSGEINAAIAVYDNAIQALNVPKRDLDPCQKSHLDHCKNTKIDMIQTYLEIQYVEGLNAANTFLNRNTKYRELRNAQKTTILCNVSKKLFERGRSDEAFYAIDRAIKISPQKYMLHLQQINMLKAHKDYARALLHYEYVFHTCPPNSTQTFFAYMDMATIYYEQYQKQGKARELLSAAGALYDSVAGCQKLKYEALVKRISQSNTL